MLNWGKSVNGVIPNTEVKRELKDPAHRNAYRTKPSGRAEYNCGKSPRHLSEMKMYAELKRTKKLKNHGIKSLWDNNRNLWTSLMFNGIPIIADTSCPANHLFFLNEEMLQLSVHKERDMYFTGFKDPINQDVEVAQVLWMGAFSSSNNRTHGKFSALTA